MIEKNKIIFLTLACIPIFLLFFITRSNFLIDSVKAFVQWDRLPLQSLEHQKIIKNISDNKPELLKKKKAKFKSDYLISWDIFFNDLFNTDDKEISNSEIDKLKNKFILDWSKRWVMIDVDISKWFTISTKSNYDNVNYNNSCLWNVCNIIDEWFFDKLFNFFEVNTPLKEDDYLFYYKLLGVNKILWKIYESNIFYENIFDSVDLLVSVFDNGFKEEYVLKGEWILSKNKKHPFLWNWNWKFTYLFYVKDLLIRLAWNSHSLQFLNSSWVVVAQIPAWYSIDALWKISFNQFYSNIMNSWTWTSSVNALNNITWNYSWNDVHANKDSSSIFPNFTNYDIYQADLNINTANLKYPIIVDPPFEMSGSWYDSWIWWESYFQSLVSDQKAIPFTLANWMYVISSTWFTFDWLDLWWTDVVYTWSNLVSIIDQYNTGVNNFNAKTALRFNPWFASDLEWFIWNDIIKFTSENIWTYYFFNEIDLEIDTYVFIRDDPDLISWSLMSRWVWFFWNDLIFDLDIENSENYNIFKTWSGDIEFYNFTWSLLYTLKSPIVYDINENIYNNGAQFVLWAFWNLDLVLKDYNIYSYPIAFNYWLDWILWTLDWISPSWWSVSYYNWTLTWNDITVDVDAWTDDSWLSLDGNDYLLEYDQVEYSWWNCLSFTDSWNDAFVSENASSTSYIVTKYSTSCFHFRYTVNDIYWNNTTYYPSVISDWTVKSYREIWAHIWNFAWALDASDLFWSSIVNIWDLDWDWITDLAIWAIDDDDWGQNRWAVWILFMNSNWTVQSHQKISDTEWWFYWWLSNSDYFWYSIANIWDIDWDWIIDLIVWTPWVNDSWWDKWAAWILFLNSDWTVKSHQEISNSVWNFWWNLNSKDHFWSSLAWIWDLDLDWVRDVIVWTDTDDDWSTNAWAVWILFLNTDWTVKSHQKISNLDWALWSVLSNDDLFWSSVANVGDLDWDWIIDLAVWAKGDDDWAIDNWAVWILFLNTDWTVKSYQKISNTIWNFTWWLLTW